MKDAAEIQRGDTIRVEGCKWVVKERVLYLKDNDIRFQVWRPGVSDELWFDLSDQVEVVHD